MSSQSAHPQIALYAIQPRQIANTDSSVAATASKPISTMATIGAPRIHATEDDAVKASPMACAKRLGGPGTWREWKFAFRPRNRVSTADVATRVTN